jgi:hypothetical protein
MITDEDVLLVREDNKLTAILVTRFRTQVIGKSFRRREGVITCITCSITSSPNRHIPTSASFNFLAGKRADMVLGSMSP